MIKWPYTTEEVARIIGADYPAQAGPGRQIAYLMTDSRKLRFADQAVFFALKGPHHDGHAFVAEAYRKGVRCFVLSDIRPDEIPADALVLCVPDTLVALQKLCRHHRRQFHLPVIGITGSNGKTTVKEWLFQILHEDYRIVRSPRSYNSQIGVPLSVWELRPRHQLGIFEAGISQTGEMTRLEAIIQPTIGLLTNIGSAHDAGFSNRQEKIAEKLKLFSKVDVLIYRSGNALIDQLVAELDIPTFCWSSTVPADLQIEQIEQRNGHTHISAGYGGEQIAVQIPFEDAAAVENAVHCWAVGLYLGLHPTVLAERLAQLSAIAMRLELQEGRNGCTLINDSYNSDLQSLAIALDFARQQGRMVPLTLILSDILQSGIPADQLYREVAALIGQFQVKRLIGVGKKIPVIDPFLPTELERRFYPDTAELLRVIDQFPFREETILIKGARPFTFESIARRLMPSTHRTLLEINLSAIAHNIRTFNALLQPGTKMLAMVKAAAYGGGSAEIARLLSFHGVQYLGVAYVDEGVELRQAGITLPIMVLNPEPVTFDSLLQHELEPEVYSLAQLEALSAFAGKAGRPIAIHLKLDTGMRRLGFVPADLPELIRRLQADAYLRVASVFSHLAAAETPAEDDFTHRQASGFLEQYERIATGLGYRPLRHLLNSAGIARFPQYQMDMVRLGIGMYGVEICRELRGHLQSVFRLRSRISQIRTVPAGESIGYGRRGTAAHERRIATVSIGYADGLLRRAGNGNYAFRVHQNPAPTVGNICMDMCMIDVSHIPEAREGDDVLIFGDDQPLEALAAVYDTIPYELLAGISHRVKRVYIME